MSEEALKVFRDRNRRIENSPALQLEQERLSREVSVLTSVFITLKQQLETTKIDEVKNSDYIIVVDPPNLPLMKSKPNKRKILVFSFFLSLAASFFVCILLEFLNHQKSSDNFRKLKREIKNAF